MADACLKWAWPSEEVHPPLGKWAIAAGIQAFGYTPIGWRTGAAVAGTVTVALLYLSARRLYLPVIAAALASLLLAVDPLHFVHSRTGMLDIFLPLFTTTAFFCCLLDRDGIQKGRSHHLWRFAAGAAAGGAIAVKWPGAFVLVVILASILWWEFSTRAKANRRGALGRTLREEGLSLLVSFVFVPVLVYVMSHTLLNPTALFTGRFWAGLARHHLFLWQHHAGLASTPGFRAPPWEWFVPTQAIAYFHEFAHLGCREVIAFASPLWLLALLLVGIALVRAGRRRSIAESEAVVLSGFALSYLPWFLALRNRSAIFMFYVLPAIPFLYLAAAQAVRRTRWAMAICAILAVLMFALYYPRLSATVHLEGRYEKPNPCAGLSVLPP
jgi:dolichyl-phosphate-mannose--protein O-mannosyl transferase